MGETARKAILNVLPLNNNNLGEMKLGIGRGKTHQEALVMLKIREKDAVAALVLAPSNGSAFRAVEPLLPFLLTGKMILFQCNKVV